VNGSELARRPEAQSRLSAWSLRPQVQRQLAWRSSDGVQKNHCSWLCLAKRPSSVPKTATEFAGSNFCGTGFLV